MEILLGNFTKEKILMEIIIQIKTEYNVQRQPTHKQ